MKLLRDNVLLQLPDHTGGHERKHKSGLTLSFSLSDEEQYAPVSGIVKEKGFLCSDLQIGDKVYFHYLSFINAKNTNEQYDKGHYDQFKTTWKEDDKYWLLMPAIELICIERDDKLIALNQFVLLKSIPKELQSEIIQDLRGQKSLIHFVSDTTGGLLIKPELKEKYRTDIAEVISGKKFNENDIVWLHKDWDVPLEREILDERVETVYYTHEDTIYAIEPKQITA